MAQRQFRSDDTDQWKYGFGNGSDGDLTISSNTTESPIDSSCSGTSGTNSLSATNASFAAGQLIMIHQTRGTGVGNWELNRISSYTAGTITTTHSLINTYTDSGASQAQVRVLKQYNNVTINNSITWTAKAWDGNVGGILAFLAKGTVTITGTISAKGNAGSVATANDVQGGNGIGYIGGDTRYGTYTASFCGEGTSGTNAQQQSANGNGGGGGYTGSSGYAGGGGGGHATSGGSGGSYLSATGGAGGGTAGVAGLTTMVFGGAGGGGERDALTQPFGAGGAGGGIVFIACQTLSISGAINIGGGNGGTGTAEHAAYGGSGAGGSGLLKCVSATLGTTLITASGGIQTGSASYPNTRGGAGGSGRLHIDYSDSYTGTTTPTIDARNDTTIVGASSLGGAFLLMFLLLGGAF